MTLPPLRISGRSWHALIARQQGVKQLGNWSAGPGGGLATALLWAASTGAAYRLARPYRKLACAAAAALGLPAAWMVVNQVVERVNTGMGWPIGGTHWVYPILAGLFLGGLAFSHLLGTDRQPESVQRARGAADLVAVLLVVPPVVSLTGEPWTRTLLLPGWHLILDLLAWESAAALGLALLAAYGLWRGQRWAWWLAMAQVALRSVALLYALRLFSVGHFTGYDHSGGVATLLALATLPAFPLIGALWACLGLALVQRSLLKSLFAANEAPRRWLERPSA